MRAADSISIGWDLRISRCPPMPTSSVWRPSGNCLLNKVKPPASTSPNPQHLHRGHWLVSHCNALVHFVQSDQFNPVVPVVFFLSLIFFCFEHCHRHLFEIWDDNFLLAYITLYTNTKASLSEFQLIMSLFLVSIIKFLNDSSGNDQPHTLRNYLLFKILQ